MMRDGQNVRARLLLRDAVWDPRVDCVWTACEPFETPHTSSHLYVVICVFTSRSPSSPGCSPLSSSLGPSSLSSSPSMPVYGLSGYRTTLPSSIPFAQTVSVATGNGYGTSGSAVRSSSLLSQDSSNPIYAKGTPSFLVSSSQGIVLGQMLLT